MKRRFIGPFLRGNTSTFLVKRINEEKCIQAYGNSRPRNKTQNGTTRSGFFFFMAPGLITLKFRTEPQLYVLQLGNCRL